MKTNVIALIILIVSVIGLQISGLWMMHQGQSNSRPIYRAIGKALCGGGWLILGIGIVGLLFTTSQ